jgi:hypothetical protein
MICAMELAPCILVVRVVSDLDKVHHIMSASSLSSPWKTLFPPDSGHLELISGCLIVLFRHMLTRIPQGLALGGIWGVREGARRPLAVSNSRLRINSVLNSVTRRGTFIGNSAGVLGLFTSQIAPTRFADLDGFQALVYNGINSSIDAFRGKHDIMGSMAAGGATGALYKSTGVDLRLSYWSCRSHLIPPCKPV